MLCFVVYLHHRMWFHYPDLSVVKKLAAEHQNRTNMLLWLSARKNNCWGSVFRKPWTVFQESEMDFCSRTFWKKSSVCAVPSKTTYLSLPLNFSVPALVIGKHVCYRTFSHTLPFPRFNIPNRNQNKELTDHQQMVTLTGPLITTVVSSSLMDLD